MCLLSHLTLSGQPGVRLPFGIRIPTVAGSFKGLIQDGETFVISNNVDRTVTFELDNNKATIPGNIVIPFTATTTTQQLADTLVVRIRDAGLGLFPYNADLGIVVLGGEGYSLDVSKTKLTQVGVSGLPGALSIPVTPDDSFTEEQVADATADAINGLGLPGVSAVPDPETLRSRRPWGGDACPARRSSTSAASRIWPEIPSAETRRTARPGSRSSSA